RARRLRVVSRNRPRLQVGRLDLNLHLAPLVLALGVGRVVGQEVLAAEVLVDLPVDGLDVLRRIDVERLASGDLGDLVQLVLDLQGFEYVKNLPLSVGIMIDTSASMLEALPEAEQAALKFIDYSVGPKDRAFVV